MYSSELISPLNHVYKKSTSGFVLSDKKVPFIFLPDEINPEENYYRQIYTLIYLLVVIGLNNYKYAMDFGFSFKKIRSDRQYKKIHNIVSNFLLPLEETEFLDDSITPEEINKIRGDFKISYSAVLNILRIRRKISRDTYNSLQLPKRSFAAKIPSVKQFFRPALISTSVKKFCGSVSSRYINASIKQGNLTPTQAQLVIFGRIRKKEYKDYLTKI